MLFIGQISDAGAQALLQALANDTHLTLLHMDGCSSVSSTTLKAFEDLVLSSTSSLKHLDFNSVQTTEPKTGEQLKSPAKPNGVVQQTEEQLPDKTPDQQHGAGTGPDACKGTCFVCCF